jgi:hypothetical protein
MLIELTQRTPFYDVEITIMQIDQNSIRRRIDEQSDLHQLLQAHSPWGMRRN